MADVSLETDRLLLRQFRNAFMYLRWHDDEELYVSGQGGEG